MGYLMSSAVEMVTVNGLPFSVVQKSGVQKLFQPYLQAIPPSTRRSIDRHSVTVSISAKAEKFRNELRKKCHRKLIPLKLDCGVRKTRCFLGVTTQFLSPSNKVQVYTLACREMKGSHTGENLKDFLLSILKKYEIQVEQVSN
jgi:hypothetical protein